MPDHPTTLAPPTAGAPDATWQPELSLRGQNVALSRAAAELRGMRGRALEVGAGTARFLRALRRRAPGLEGYACDLESRGLLLAQQQDPALRAAQGDLTALPFRDGAYDVVLVFDVFEHLYRPELGVRECWRVLAPGGVLHALVPCEGQPLTLHWLMWRANLAADLKEKRVGHVQRFTHSSLRALLEESGFRVRRISYSMHPLGQIKDVLMYLEQGDELPRWLWRNPLYRALSLGLWAGSFVESGLLRSVPLSAVSLHVTAVKPCAS